MSWRKRYAYATHTHFALPCSHKSSPANVRHRSGRRSTDHTNTSFNKESGSDVAHGGVMHLTDLIEKYQQRIIDSERDGSTAPVARLLTSVVADLRELDDGNQAVMVSTTEAACRARLAPKTIRQRCRDGRIRGARKTSPHGEWRIPLSELPNLLDTGSATSLRRLWGVA